MGKQNRITKLWVERPLMNRLSYWLYDKYCGEPYFPEGEVKANVVIGDPECLGHDGRDNSVKIVFEPKKFIPGVHDAYIFNVEINDKRK